ncbi:hypothetical protein EV182_008126, partial [Spiromyces aspiralis]
MSLYQIYLSSSVSPLGTPKKSSDMDKHIILPKQHGLVNRIGFLSSIIWGRMKLLSTSSRRSLMLLGQLLEPMLISLLVTLISRVSTAELK